jgi:DTW domain-containing protein YfiP
LKNSEIWVRGQSDQPRDEFTPESHPLPLLLFPGKGAIPLTEFIGSSQPVTLVVPDGTWRQASKVQRRVPTLARLTVVSLPEGPASQYRLRREAHGGGLATLEAIARAFGVLEGQEVQQALERVFRIMVERTLWSRGELHTSRVTDGIPEGALQHDPLSGVARG